MGESDQSLSYESWCNWVTLLDVSKWGGLQWGQLCHYMLNNSDEIKVHYYLHNIRWCENMIWKHTLGEIVLVYPFFATLPLEHMVRKYRKK